MALEDHSRLMQAYIAKAMVDLPSLPTVIIEVVRATERETVSTHEIEELISTDAAISTKLLKVVNSAYFGMPRQVLSINQAIAILGMHQVKNLVLSIGVLNALSTAGARIEDIQRSFWERSFGTASCAQMLGKVKRLPAQEQELLFIGGLLHDIGVLFLLTQFTTPYLEVLKSSHIKEEPLVKTERHALHTDHAEIGGMLAAQWNFPHELAELITAHESPVSPDQYPMGACLYVADRISGQLGSSELGYASPVDKSQLEWLGIDEDELGEIRASVEGQIQRAKELLGLIK